MLGTPHCIDNRLTDGNKGVSLTHSPRSSPQKYYFYLSDTHFDRLCGLVVRVLGYRSGGPGFDYRHYQKKSSGSGTGFTQPREYN
jgi:hypothetical protein